MSGSVRIFLFIFCFFSAVSLFSQQPDNLFKKIDQQLNLYNNSDLFLHLDKSVYVAGEKLWFSAYAFGGKSSPDSVNTLYLVLVNDMSQTVVASERYLLENGIAAGSVSIPDSLQTGAYSLLAYTNSFFIAPFRESFFPAAG